MFFQRLDDLTTTPLLVNLKPVGNGYIEGDFAGDMGALLHRLKTSCIDCQERDDARRLAHEGDGWIDRAVVAERENRLDRTEGWSRCSEVSRAGAVSVRPPIPVWRGRSRGLLVAQGVDRVDDPDLGVDAKDVLVLRNATASASAIPQPAILNPRSLPPGHRRTWCRISSARHRRTRRDAVSSAPNSASSRCSASSTAIACAFR